MSKAAPTKSFRRNDISPRQRRQKLDRPNNCEVIPTTQVSFVSEGPSRYASTRIRQHGLG